MTQRIFYIGGGEAQENHEDYYSFLASRDYDPFAPAWDKNWSDNLQNDLGDEFECIKIPMPNKWFADYKAWEIVFEKFFPFMREGDICICNSLGCSFLLRYLSLWKKLSLEFSKIFFMAPPLHDSSDEVLGWFNFDTDAAATSLQALSTKIYIYHSQDDHIVPVVEGRELASLVSGSMYREFEDKGHFYLEKKIDELIQDICM